MPTNTIHSFDPRVCAFNCTGRSGADLIAMRQGASYLRLLLQFHQASVVNDFLCSHPHRFQRLWAASMIDETFARQLAGAFGHTPTDSEIDSLFTTIAPETRQTIETNARRVLLDFAERHSPMLGVRCDWANHFFRLMRLAETIRSSGRRMEMVGNASLESLPLLCRRERTESRWVNPRMMSEDDCTSHDTDIVRNNNARDPGAWITLSEPTESVIIRLLPCDIDSAVVMRVSRNGRFDLWLTSIGQFDCYRYMGNFNLHGAISGNIPDSVLGMIHSVRVFLMGEDTINAARRVGCTIRQYCSESGEPIPSEVTSSILLSLRRYANTSGGWGLVDNRYLTTTSSRRMGVTRLRFNRVLGARLTAIEFAGLMTTMPMLPRGWLSADARMAGDQHPSHPDNTTARPARRSATPPAPPARARSWDWTSIPADVARIMELDLTLHLDEPTEAA